MNYLSNEMDESLWVNLKVIANLQPFQRINTRPRLFQISQSNSNNAITSITLIESLQRWWTKSSRSSDFERIKDLYEYAEKKLNSSEKKEIERLKTHLQDSLKGLQSLQKTYEDDVTLKARIDCLIDYVNTLLEMETINK